MGLISKIFKRQGKPSTLERSNQLLSQQRHVEALSILEAWLPSAPRAELPRGYALLASACLTLNLNDRAANAALDGLKLDDSLAELHLYAGLCKSRAGDQAAAESYFRQCLKLEPDYVEAKLALSQLLCSTGRVDEAFGLVTEGSKEGSADPQILFAAAKLYVDSGRLDDAKLYLQQFFEATPNHPEALMLLGVIASRQGQEEQATQHFRAALQLKPGDSEISLHLAGSLGRAGQYLEAVELLESLDFDDNMSARVLGVLAELHVKAGAFERAQLCCAKAATLDLDNPEYYFRLGTLLMEAGRFYDAIGALTTSLSIKETFQANRALGVALLRAFKPADALLAFEAAKRERPDDVETNVLLNTAKRSSLNSSVREQLQEYRRLVTEHPNEALAHSSLLFHLSFDKDTSPEAYIAQALKFGEGLRHVPPLEPRPERVRGQLNQQPLRVGFVSADFNDHPVGYFFEALIAEIDTDKYQLFGYSNSSKSDELTNRIRPRFTSWQMVRFLDDQKLASMIQSDCIDILFDLNGHTSFNRLSMFAYRPARIQATWLGYWASTGLATIDYIVADTLSVPPEHEHHFCERVIRMPVTRLCYGNSLPERPPVTQAPSVVNGYVTFGCFQALHKIEPPVVAAWRRILEAAPDCRLRVRSVQFADPQVLKAATASWKDQGLSPDRTELLPPLPRGAYLQSYSEVDVALDTFPYPGGTTTTQALWMGVPTLTMEGGTMLSRQGMALMSAAGLSEWVAKSEDEYVEKALQICTAPDRIAKLRKGLRQTVKASPLFDAPRFARDFEAMLERMVSEHAGTFH